MSRLAAGLAAVALAVASWGTFARPSQATSSPARVAGSYVKQLAASNGVTILGDKVWSVRKHGEIYTVAVRVKYKFVPRVFGVQVAPARVGWTTIFVHVVESGYVVVG